MKKPLRLAARISFLLFVLVLLGLGVVMAWFTSWRSDKQAALDAASEMAETSLGKIEYVTRGEGPAVLVFHGAPGGYDQAMLFGSGLAANGFEVVAPSRPGYLRTPLSTGLLPLQEADAMLALLDQLGLDKVAVMGVDAGALPAIEFAARHPDRTWALVLVSPITKRIEHWKPKSAPELGKEIQAAVTGDMGSWYCVKTAEKDPARAIGWMLDVANTADATQRAITTEVILKQPGQLEWFQAFMGTFAPDSARYDGTRNDQFRVRSIEDLPLKKITAPTLLIRGELDRGVLLEDVKVATAGISGASLYEVPNAGHVIWLGPKAADAETKIEEFLKQHAPGSTQP
ncbi:alpha/beta hydrolase [soil metagenome]